MEAYLEKKPLVMACRGRDTGAIFVDFAELALPEEARNSTLSPKILGSNAVTLLNDKPSFIDYINGGCSIGVVVAIDSVVDLLVLSCSLL